MHAKADELPLFTTGSDHHTTKQVVFFHQPVHFLLVNVKTVGLQILTDFAIPGKEHELFCEYKADANHHTLVLNQASITEQRMGGRLTTSFATIWVIVVGAVRKSAPLKQPRGFTPLFKELNNRAFLFDSQGLFFSSSSLKSISSACLAMIFLSRSFSCCKRLSSGSTVL